MQNYERSILVTGGEGFIGSNFISYILNIEPMLRIVNLDKPTYAGTLENLKEIGPSKNNTFIDGNI
jgi:dTDP-glucose 4,6-dehydratase